MQLDAFPGIYLIVEGHTDRALFSNLLCGKRSRIKVGDGKKKVLNILRELHAARRVAAVVDADTWLVTGKAPKLRNLFTTDTADLESLMIRSDAFVKTLNVHCHLDALDQFVESRNLPDRASVRMVLLKSASRIGYVRVQNAERNLGVDFKELRFDEFINGETLELNNNAFCDALGRQHETFRSFAEECLEEAKSSIDEPWRYSNGHDMIRILVVGLNSQTLGYARHYSSAGVEDGLRQAYEVRHFKETKLCEKIEQWASNEAGGSLLKN